MCDPEPTVHHHASSHSVHRRTTRLGWRSCILGTSRDPVELLFVLELRAATIAPDMDVLQRGPARCEDALIVPNRVIRDVLYKCVRV